MYLLGRFHECHQEHTNLYDGVFRRGGRGLQILAPRFDSGRGLHHLLINQALSSNGGASHASYNPPFAPRYPRFTPHFTPHRGHKDNKS
jgi:hypothetical protein